jgi:hypothetical protein
VSSTVCIFSNYFCILIIKYAPIFYLRNCFDIRFKIDIVVMIILSIVIIISFVLTLQVSTASLSNDREPARNKGCVQPHLFASYLRLRTGRVGGEYAYWLLTEGIASLLGVSQVTLFRSGSVPNSTKNLIYVFPEMKLCGLVPNSYIYVSLSDFYFPRIGLPIWLQQNRQTDPRNI